MLGLSPEETRAQKLGTLRRALVHELDAGIEEFPIAWRASNHGMGYRHRVRLKIHQDGQLGFFNQEKSINCPVLDRSLLRATSELTAFSCGRESLLAELCHVEVRAPDLDGKAAACFFPRDAAKPPSPELVKTLLELGEKWLVAVASPEAVIPCQRHALTDLYHYVPLTSFLQVNRVVNDALVGDLCLGAVARNLRTFCDLYAGAGNFTLPLLAVGLSGTAVEFDNRAMSACKRSAEAQALEGGLFLSGDATAHTTTLSSNSERFDLVIIDPPRAGIRNAVSTIAQLCRSHLVYCSCNPVSLAKDLRALLALGMTIEQVTAYDMFAGTHHLETCVWLKAP